MNSFKTSLPFRLPLAVHAMQMAGVIGCIAIFRIRAVQSLVEVVLSRLPYGFYAEKYANGYFQPLSTLGWVVHVSTLIWGLEIIMASWDIYRRCTKDNVKMRHAYKSLAALFLMSQIQALSTIVSHSLINVNPTLEVQLLNFEYLLMRLHVFGYSGVLWFGPWSLLPLAALVIQDILLFHSPAGIVASTLSMMAVLAESSFPIGYKASWVLLAFLPMLFPDSSNDKGHTTGAAMVTGSLFLISVFVNAKAREEKCRPKQE